MSAAGRGRRGGLEVTVVGLRTPSAAGLGAWLAAAAPARARGAVTVALVTDRRIRTLNRTFRAADYATDVLSFPAGPPDAPGAGPRTPPPLGDVAIAMGVARRQARRERHALATELRILALHGLLHLLGYDHERDRGAMRAVEERLRRRAGLPVGLIARTRGPVALE